MQKTVLHSILILLITLCTITSAFGQNEEGDTEKIRTKQRVSYVYNFANYIDWELIENKAQFKIGILGDQEQGLIEEFEKVAKVKTIKELPVSIESFSSINEIKPTQILYLNAKYNYNINHILELAYLNNCLLITEGYPFQHSMINFIEIDKEFHFEMSEGKINRAQLLVDPALASFSIRSTADWNLLYNKLQDEKSTVQEQQIALTELAEQIQEQKTEIEDQQNKLQFTINEIEVQNLLLSDQKEIIAKKNDAIQHQTTQLNALSERITEQKDINQELLAIFQSQQDSIEKQTALIRDQKATLNGQNEAIDLKEKEIEKQNDILKIRLSEIAQQRLLLYISLAFILLIFIFSLILYRSYNKRKRSEKALQVKNTELIALNKSLDSFTYRVSHDLKAPVINVKNMIKMLEEFTDKGSNPMLIKIFDNLHISSNRLEGMITDLLKLTRIERVKEQKTLFDFKRFTDKLCEEFKDEMTEINGTINTETEENQPIYASTIEMSSIYRNLITNSIKYRDETKKLNINISTKELNNHLEITYSDNGIGIDLNKHKDNIFGMFQRFDNRKEIAGTGVGMYIIKKLVDNNNGTIQLNSTPGNGLTYIIKLPSKAE